MAWGVLFKLESYGIGGELINLFKDYLQACQQSVVLNGFSSSWEVIKSGVPQGSVLGPLLFLIYINDLSDGLSSTCNIFSNDTSLFSFVHDKYVPRDEFNNDLKKKRFGSLTEIFRTKLWLSTQFQRTFRKQKKEML